MTDYALAERFWAKVDRSGECWLWRGANNGDGRYGKILINGCSQRAHRVSWELFGGTIPPDMHVLHKCDTPLCVRPDHLFLGTHTDNMRDAMRKGRLALGELNGKSKLTDPQVREIRSLFGKCRATALADRFGVNARAIHHVWRRDTWAHVT